MARPWWQRLRRPGSPNANVERSEPIFAFTLSDDSRSGWWLRAESRPVRVGITAAAKAAPLMLSAWTHNIPQPEERPLLRGAERLALLDQWASKFAA